jgi:arylsulfatase A
MFRKGVSVFAFVRTCSVLLLLAATVWSARAASPDQVERRPNIILILADDLGKQDVGIEGADLHETPHLDGLARSGMRFTHAYSPGPVCTPTRASILTGKSPARLHMTVWSEGSRNGPTDRQLRQAPSLHDLSRSEVTLARHFQAHGYLTASVGKWHLGEASFFPEAHGFDIGIAGNHWGAPATFFAPYRGSGRFGPEMRYVPHLEFSAPGEYLTDRLTDEAIRVIDHAAVAKKPFFLYLPHYAPHTPIEAKEADVEYFASRVKPDMKHQNSTYAAMIRSLDESVGRILQTLNDRSLDENTIVVFSSDNGGYIGNDRVRNIPVTNNHPLRSGKGSLYEGGLRVPLYICWPGVTSAGSKCQQRVILTDLFPTLMKAAGLTLPEDVPSDGLNLVDVLRTPASKLPRNELFFHYPHYYHAPAMTPASSVIADGYKLIESFEDGRKELFHLDADPAEEHDLSGTMPEKVLDLQQRLSQWRLRSGAALPFKNPEYVPVKAMAVDTDNKTTSPAVEFSKDQKQLVITVSGKPLATYVFGDPKTPRPYFAHVFAGSGGAQLTRNHPPRPEDAQDHDLMHPGIWFALGDLSGHDNWRLKAPVAGGEFIQPPTADGHEGRFAVRNRYLAADGKQTLCREDCTWRFVPQPWGCLLVMDSTFTSETPDLTFGDHMEEMGLGIRVASALAVKSGKGGRILDSEGRRNEAGVREKLSDWCDYSGPLNNAFGGITVMDSPQNPRRIWWHARDYGFMTANAFHAHPDRRDQKPIKLQPGESVRFRYGIALHHTTQEADYDPAAAWNTFLKIVNAD